MEDQNGPADFSIDLFYLYYNVPVCRPIIFGQLGIVDLYTLALANKQFGAMVMGFVHFGLSQQRVWSNGNGLCKVEKGFKYGYSALHRHPDS